MPIRTYRYAEERRWLRPPLADVHLPDRPGPHPSVVVVHGGGFLGGWRRMRAVWTVVQALREGGYAVMAMDYRVVFRGGGLDEALEDLHAGMAWWRAQVETFQLDPERISLVGLSAGGALVTLAARTEVPLHALVGIYGVYDFTDLPWRSAFLGRFLLRSMDHSVWRQRSPWRNCLEKVPMLLQHGTADGIVPVRHTTRLANFRRTHDLPVITGYYDGAGHAFYRHPELPVTRKALEDLLDFLDDPDAKRPRGGEPWKRTSSLGG
ncbi:MAG: alpha/beta hydrolase [Deltaproteobacteria bacterium]|nr:alpha/beta hydrolase [Deltaproteobacteria bacterium]MBW2254331.1 alpha/beta hydrolase [Deltaproteobacteria bacterium]